MKNCKLKRLSLAVGLALSAGAMMQSAQAVIVSPDNLGQALIFPYYTVNDGWNSLFHVTNTSDRVVVVKARFRESYNSRDVFDFNIVLSPHDVWTGWVADSSAGPTLFSEDNSCTVGRIPTYAEGGQAFPDPISYVAPYNDGGPTAASRMNEGYVEMIMMGASEPKTAYETTNGSGSFAKDFPLAAGAIHVNGQPTAAGCSALVSAFQNPDQLQNLIKNFPYLEDTTAAPLNVLKGQYSLVNGALGLNAVGLPTHLANFHVGADTTGSGVGSLVSLQLEATGVAEVAVPPTGTTIPYNRSWHEPSLSSSNIAGNYIITALADSLQADAITTATTNIDLGDADNVSSALARASILNEFSSRTDAAAGWVTSTDWVITFPTKNFYVDLDASNPFSGQNNLRGNVGDGTPAPFSSMFVNVNSGADPVTSARNGQSCDQIQFTIRNREEQSVTGGGFSPGSVARLCYEANVLTFNNADLLGSPAPLNGSIATSYLYGWLNVGLPNPTATGLPVVGFSIITRSDATSALLSEAGLTDHSYTRPLPTLGN